MLGLMLNATFLNLFTQYYFMDMKLTITMGRSDFDDSVRKKKTFPVEIEDTDGNKITARIRFVPKYMLDGEIGKVLHEENGKLIIELPRRTPPILSPILAQMLYLKDAGWPEDLCKATAMQYGFRVLNNADSMELARILGFETRGVVPLSACSGDGGFYARHLIRYLEKYENASYIRIVRALQSVGMGEEARDYGVAPLVTEAILSDTDQRKIIGEDGKPELMPAPGEEIPYVIAVLTKILEKVRSLYSEQKSKKQRAEIRIHITDPFALRILYNFSDDIVADGPVFFDDKEEWGRPRKDRGSDVVFKPGSIRTIAAVIKQLQAKIAAQYRVIDKLLAASKKRAAILASRTDGLSFKELADGIKNLTPAQRADLLEKKRVASDIKQLEIIKTGLADALAGKANKPKPKLRIS